MPTETLNESVARSKAFSKSTNDERDKASYEANAHAVAMPLKKSAVEDNTTFLTAIRVMQRVL